MASPTTRRVHCNVCGRENNHLVLHVEKTHWASENDDITGGNTYETLRCGGCDEVVLRKKEWCSEDHPTDPDRLTFYPPATLRPQPKWLHDLWLEFPVDEDSLHDLLKEIYVGLQNDQPFLAAMGIRALIERIMVTKCGDQGTFAKNLDAFERAGFVSALQRQRLETVLEAGHAAIHRGYKPSKEDLVTLLDLTEAIVQTIYLHGSRIEDLKKRIPARKKPSS